MKHSFLLMLCVIAAGSCSDGILPEDPPPMVESFVLERVDGSALGVQKALPDGPCQIERGRIDFRAAGTLTWSIACAKPVIAPNNLGGVALEVHFRQVRTDSVVFPGNRLAEAEPFAFGRVDGVLFSLRTTSVAPLVGAGEWVFRRAP
jgi:hypothetical protein